MSDITTEDQLFDDFSPQEVQITRDILACQKLQPLPSTLRRAILLTLRGHYSNAINYGEYYQHLACYVYNEDASQSSLYVGYTKQNDDSKPDNTPGIYVDFGDLAFSKVALGNFSGLTDDRAGTHMSKVINMNLRILHIAAKADDAYDLAEMTSVVLTSLAQPIILQMNAMGLEVTSIGQPEKKNQAPSRNYTVVTSVQISYTTAVTRSVESHRLRRIAELITV